MARPPPESAQVEVPLAATAVGILVGIAWSATPWRVAGLLVGLVAVSCSSRARPVAWAGLLGLVSGMPLQAAEHVRTPGVYVVQVEVHGGGAWVRGGVLVRGTLTHVGGRPLPGGARVRLLLPGALASQCEPGARVTAIARLRRQAGASRSFRAHVPHVDAVHDVRPPPSAGALSRVRASAAARLTGALDDADAGLLRAMVLGDRGGVHREDRQRFRATGQAHLLAVSGLHVGLWLVGLLLLLRLLGVGPRAQGLAALGLVAICVPLTGAPPSAVRAGCAAGLHFTGRLLGRHPAPLVVLTIVAVCLVCVEPHALHEVAFQLSFTAVLGILVLTAPITAVLVRPRPLLPGFVRPPRAAVRRSLAVSLAAWMGTLPVVAHAIGHVAPAGPLVAVVAIPLTAAALLTGLLLLLLGGIPGLGTLLAWLAEHAVAALRGTLEGASDLGLVAHPMPAPPPGAVVVYAVACLHLARSKDRRAAGRALALCLALVAAWWFGGSAPPEEVQGYHPQRVSVFLPLLVSGLRTPASAAILAGAMVLAVVVTVRARWLTLSGALCAAVLGMLAGWTFGLAGLAGLFAPFLVATLLGKLSGPGRAGARTARQVASNGVPAALGCGIALLGSASAGAACFVGALACLGADTCATEIGVRYGGAPRTLWGARVGVGESGGMTLAGTLAALAGSLLAPVAWSLVEGGDGGVRIVGLFAAAGFAGALIDSALGASLQFRGRAKGTITEKTHVDGAPVEHVRGLRWLDNDAVNLVTGLLAGAIAVALLHLGFGGAA